jgi:hypothetical protein
MLLRDLTSLRYREFFQQPKIPFLGGLAVRRPLAHLSLR